MYGVSSEARAFPDQRSLFGQKFGHLSANELITDRFVAVRVQFVGICHLPCAGGDAVVIADGFLDGGVLGLLGVEGVAVWVLGAADLARALSGVDLENSVVGPVDVGVDAEAEEMLVIVCVDSGIDFCSPALGVLAWVHGIGV